MLASRQRSFVFGFLDQALSSATNLSLSLLAGRLLGPSGLGTVFVGFSFYIVALGFQRALLTTPLVAATAARPDEARHEGIRAGFMVVLILGSLMTLLFAAGGLLIPVSAASGLLLFVPWLLPALLQDYCRALLFQERRPGAATLTDLAWAGVMVLLAVLVATAPTDWRVVAAWGGGAVAGAIVGLVLLRTPPAAPATAVRWWHEQVWPFGRWLAAEAAVYNGIYWATTLTLAAALGAASLGALQAAQSLFAPLSLLGAAVTLPGLPALTRAVSEAFGGALRLATGVSALVVGLALGYLLLVAAAGESLLTVIFGDDFAPFSGVLYPIAAWQLVAAVGIGFQLLLRALQRGRALFITRVVASSASYAAITLLAITHGTTGAAWGYAIGSAVETGAYVFLAQRERRRHRRA